jgi:hypothetical protein
LLVQEMMAAMTMSAPVPAASNAGAVPVEPYS